MIIIDDFFREPELIVDYANSLEYTQKNINFPGARTECLSEINPLLFKEIIAKIAGSYSENIHFIDASMFFQKVPSKYKNGIIHNDKTYTAIIYLNKKGNGGTSTYTLTSLDFLEPSDYKPEDLFQKNDLKSIEERKKEVHKHYDLDISVSGKYNRCLFFDGREPHSANSFDIEKEYEEEERLTLISFINVIGCISQKERMGNMSRV